MPYYQCPFLKLVPAEPRTLNKSDGGGCLECVWMKHTAWDLQ